MNRYHPYLIWLSGIRFLEVPEDFTTERLLILAFGPMSWSEYSESQVSKRKSIFRFLDLLITTVLSYQVWRSLVKSNQCMEETFGHLIFSCVDFHSICFSICISLKLFVSHFVVCPIYIAACSYGNQCAAQWHVQCFQIWNTQVLHYTHGLYRVSALHCMIIFGGFVVVQFTPRSTFGHFIYN